MASPSLGPPTIAALQEEVARLLEYSPLRRRADGPAFEAAVRASDLATFLDAAYAPADRAVGSAEAAPRAAPYTDRDDTEELCAAIRRGVLRRDRALALLRDILLDGERQGAPRQASELLSVEVEELASLHLSGIARTAAEAASVSVGRTFGHCEELPLFPLGGAWDEDRGIGDASLEDAGGARVEARAPTAAACGRAAVVAALLRGILRRLALRRLLHGFQALERHAARSRILALERAFAVERRRLASAVSSGVEDACSVLRAASIARGCQGCRSAESGSMGRDPREVQRAARKL